jgi:hypothetical protein
MRSLPPIFNTTRLRGGGGGGTVTRGGGDEVTDDRGGGGGGRFHDSRGIISRHLVSWDPLDTTLS